MSYRHRVSYYDHAGGLNNEKSLFNIAPNESRDLRNVILDQGVIATRHGCIPYRNVKVAPEEEDQAVTSLFEFINSEQQAYLLATAGTKLKKAAAEGWTELKDGFTVGAYFHYVVNSLIMKTLFVNGKDGYFETDGETCTAVEPYEPTLEEILEFGYNAIGAYTEYAELVTDLPGENNDLVVMAQLPGPTGKEISLEYIDPGDADQELEVEVTSKKVTINLATDADGEITTTAGQIRLAVNEHADAKELIFMQNKEGNDGSGVVVAMSETNLGGGEEYEQVLTEPQFITYHRYRTWLAKGDRIYYCGEDIEGNVLYNYFPLTNWLRSANPRGEQITAIYPYRGNLYVFTKKSIRVIVGEEPSDFMLMELDNTIGAVSQRSICIINGHLFFLGTDGIYMMDEQTAPKRISQRIPENIRRINTNRRNWAAAVPWRNKYRISFAESNVNDAVLEYDTDVIVITYIGKEQSYSSKAWVYHKGIYANDWLVAHNENLYFASNDGYVYQYGIGYMDNQEPIDSYYTTAYIDSGIPDQVKRFRSLHLEYEPTSGFMLLEYRTHETEEWKELEEIDLSKRQPYISFGRGVRARRIQLRFRTTGPGSYFKIYGYTPDVAIRGHQYSKINEGKE